LKPKPTRKNRFKKSRQIRQARWRQRIVATLRVVTGTLALLVASGAFIFAHDYFTQSRQFQVRRIEVSGVQQLSRQQVLATAGIGSQSNILSVNLAVTRKRLLAAPWIADARVSRQIPSGLQLHITEERPLALLDMGRDQGFLINADGVVFNRQAPATSDGIPRIEGLTHADLPIVGQPPSKAFEAVMSLLHLVGKPGSALANADVRRIHMDRDIGATVYIGSGDRAVKLGFGRYRQKCDALGPLLVRLRQDRRLAHYRVIDLYDVNRIVITLASTDASDAHDKEV
jgi:cell division protein FtsQ